MSSYRLVRTAPARAAAPVLDAQQQRVVDHDAGPLLVLAGPGTGKTTTLVEAAAARVRSGVPVEQLMMLTFSRRAAGELRNRVATRLERTTREPLARTIHSYAFGVLRMASAGTGEPAPRLLSAAEQDVMLRDLIAGSDPDRWPVGLRPALHTRGFAGEVRDLLLRAVERGLDGPGLAELGRRHGRPDWVSAGGLLTEYAQVTALERPGAYDPAELVRAAIDLLRSDRHLLAVERSRRRRLFVDEYQDTDPAQLELLALLADGADELILVGDADQSIYAFRGADTGAIRDAGDLFGGGSIETVALGTCRRFGPVLLEATRRVAARLPGPAAHRRLVAAPGLAPGEVEVALLRSAGEEADHVAAVLRRAHLEGMPWSRMSVLVRSTTTSLARLRRAMTTAGVPVRVDAEDVPLAAQPAVALLLDVLDLVTGAAPLDESAAERLLLGPVGGADALSLRRLRRAADQSTGSAELAPVIADPLAAALLPEPLGAGALRVARVLASGRDALGGGTPEDVLWSVWEATGLAARWARASRAGGAAGAAADRDLDAVVALFDAAARFTDRLPGAPVARFAEHVAAQQIPGDLAGHAPQADAVAILTAHASKGLEWDLVCVAGVQEGVWPDLRRRGSLLGGDALVDLIAGGPAAMLADDVASRLAEERRLFYVAATRARQRLVVTAVAGEEEQPSRFLDELLPPSGDDGRPLTQPLPGTSLAALVAELRAAACDPGSADGPRSRAVTQLARLAAAGVPGADPDDWWGLAPLSDDGPVADPARPVPVSPSRVEAYADCQLRALLHDLGAAEGGSAASSLGTAIHAVAAEAPPGADLADLERLLDERFAALDFGAGWFAAHERQRARAMLARLAGWLAESRTRLQLVGVERDFAVEVGDARISGRVDRLERDAQGRLVVIDLKTGKSKPKDADLPTNPQLGAYQLAVDAGGFGDGERAGGAALLQLGSNTKVVEQQQVPLAEADDPEWIAARVSELAALLRGNVFTATGGGLCARCDVRGCCPLQPDGHQVTS